MPAFRRALGLSAIALFMLHAAGDAAPPQSASRRAGEIRALIPTTSLLRSGQPQMDARRGDAVNWQDILRTDRGGRVRLVLDDGSILNVGSDSQLQVVRHDAAAQSTDLQLAYGRMRASVVRIARPGGSFQVRTPVAVAGVVGTRLSIQTTPEGDTLVIALEDRVRVRNINPQIPGEVTLEPGQFTRVARDAAPTPPAPATPEMLRDAEEGSDVPVDSPPLARVEISWPPAACGAGSTLLVRGFRKDMREGKEVEVAVDADLLSGTLRLGAQSVTIEMGRGQLAQTPASSAPQGNFTPRNATAPVETRIWPPVDHEAGDGWRAPRAVLIGNAFAVLGPMGAGTPSFSFGRQQAALIWQGPCGAGFIAPVTVGREFEVILSLNGQPVARGVMNLISFSYRTPVPPTVTRGMQSRFGIDIQGLENLVAFTQGRPVIVTTVINTTPSVIGNLQSATPGARASGETITYMVGAQNAGAAGTAKLDGVGTARGAGAFLLDVTHVLDAALSKPRTPLKPAQ